MPDFDVMISGYGPTGAVAANLLGQRGVRVLVVDPSPDIYDIPRAVHFDGEVMRIFQSLGLSDEIQAVSGTAQHLAFVNAWGWTLRAIDVTDVPETHGWPVGNFFNQPLLERRLRAGVARFPSVEVRLGTRLESFEQDDDGLAARIARVGPDGESTEPETIRVSYLLGCDGASSPTRREAGIDLEDLHCHEPWLVCDLVLDDDVDFQRDALQICDPARPTTLVPCEGQHIRWEFMLMPGDDPDQLESEATARAMMAPHMHHLAPGLSADGGRLIRSKVYTFHSLVAHEFRAGRAFLLGDAAHQTPPFLGQGLNAGFRDAVNLGWKIPLVMAGICHQGLLDSYAAERDAHARDLVEWAVAVGQLMETLAAREAGRPDPYPSADRSAGYGQGRSAPPLRDGVLVREQIGGESPVGMLLRQPTVRGPDGLEDRLDERLGPGFAIVARKQGDLRLSPNASRQLERLGGRAVSLEDLEVTKGESDRLFDAHPAVILRPDRYVFGVVDEEWDLDRLVDELSRKLALV